MASVHGGNPVNILTGGEQNGTYSQTGQYRFVVSALLIVSVHNVLRAKLLRGGPSWTKSLPRRTTAQYASESRNDALKVEY